MNPAPSISLTQYLIQTQRARKGTSAEIDTALVTLLEAIARSCKRIAIAVRRGALSGVTGDAGSSNVQGEMQKRLDVIANDTLLAASEWTGHLAGMASEEMDEPYAIPAEYPQGPYLLLFDPLDGSSNIDVNVSIGTIFSVLKAPMANQGHGTTASDFLQSGRKQIAAGYAVYGPSAQLILTVGDGVVGFTLDSETGSWLMTQPKMTIPSATKEFAINMSNERHWEAPVRRYVAELLAGTTGPRNKDFNMRWVASMVADVHRILTRGGIFMYPRDAREPEKPGKLRLMYEANPMSMLVEQAGGLATNGHQAILDLEPSKLHERVAVFLGSKEEVERVTRYHTEA